MMERWNAAQRKGPGPLGAVVSVVVHAAIIGASVYETSRPAGPPEELHPMALVRFLAPPNREIAQAYQPEQVRYVSIAVPDGIVAPTVTTPILTETPAPPIALGDDLFDAPETPALAGLDSVYSIIDVDSAASRYEWSAAPVFPQSMLALGISGFVRAQWVVDTAGVPDTASLRVLESTHPEFEKAVRDALPFMRFRPAKIGSQYVRQLVEQPFNFRINRPTPPDSTVPPLA